MPQWLRYIIIFVVLCAVIAVLYIGLPAMGIAVPGFVVSIIWVLFVAFVIIAAIVLLWSWISGFPPPKPPGT